jgi:cell division protein DivIC
MLQQGGEEGVSMEGRKRKRRFDFFVPLMVVLIGYFAFVLVSQQVHLGQIAENQAAAEERLSAAKVENEALKQEKAALSDPAYIEKIAREDLGMTRHGELPYTAARK